MLRLLGTLLLLLLWLLGALLLLLLWLLGALLLLLGALLLLLLWLLGALLLLLLSPLLLLWLLSPLLLLGRLLCTLLLGRLLSALLLWWSTSLLFRLILLLSIVAGLGVGRSNRSEEQQHRHGADKNEFHKDHLPIACALRPPSIACRGRSPA